MADATRKGVSQTPPVSADDERAENEHAQNLNDNLPGDTGEDPGAAAGAEQDPPKGQDEPKAPPVNPRRAAFAEAVKARREAVREELVETATLEGDQPPAPEGEGEGEPEPAKKPAAAAPADAAAQNDGGDRFKIKVYGQDREVTREELIKLAQRGAASQQAFDEAARLRKEAEDLAAGRVSPKSTKEPPEGAPADNGAEDDQPKSPGKKPDFKAIAKALQYGEEEDAEKAIEALLEHVGRAGGATPVNEDAVERVVEARLARERAADAYQRDLETVGGEFAAVFEDPDLTHLAAQRVHRVRADELIELGYPGDQVNQALATQEGQRRIMEIHSQAAARGQASSNVDVFRTACKAVSEKFGGLQSKPSAPGARDRVAEKRQLPQPPAARSARASVGQDAQPPKSRSSVVADMRRSRGQPL